MTLTLHIVVIKQKQSKLANSLGSLPFNPSFVVRTSLPGSVVYINLFLLLRETGWGNVWLPSGVHTRSLKLCGDLATNTFSFWPIFFFSKSMHTLRVARYDPQQSSLKKLGHLVEYSL